jgi:hypothetical protein
METKICTKCNVEKSFSEFVKNKNTKTGIGSTCKECVKKYSQDRYKTHSHIWKNWIDNNKEQIAIKQNIYKSNNKEKIKEYMSSYMTPYSKSRYQNNLEYKLQKVLRSRLYIALKNEYKQTSAVDLIGCSLEQLKKHLEMQFDDKMNWSNYGSYWEIDHIKQIFNFDLKYFQNQQQCFHYSNLRPLSKLENQKRAKK